MHLFNLIVELSMSKINKTLLIEHCFAGLNAPHCVRISIMQFCLFMLQTMTFDCIYNVPCSLIAGRSNVMVKSISIHLSYLLRYSLLKLPKSSVLLSIVVCFTLLMLYTVVTVLISPCRQHSASLKITFQQSYNQSSGM